MGKMTSQSNSSPPSYIVRSISMAAGEKNLSKSVLDSQDDCLIVAAIDFGTTFSGYAFSVKTKRGEVIMNKNWGKDTGMTTFKAPTCVLTEVAANGRDHIFQKFGFQAQNDYVRRFAEPDKDRLCLFNKFKMKLHREVNTYCCSYFLSYHRITKFIFFSEVFLNVISFGCFTVI